MAIAKTTYCYGHEMNKLVTIYNTLRALIVTLLIIGAAIPVGLYVILSTPWAQKQLREITQDQLSQLLGTEVSIGSIEFEPFDQIKLHDVIINDDFDQQALKVGTLSSRFEIGYLLSSGHLSFDYAVIDRLDARIYKKNHNGPLNIAGIIEHLKPKDQKKPPTKFEFEIGTVKITNSSVSYDILDAPETPNRFNPNHIHISGLNLLANLPKVTNQGISINLPRLNFSDASGIGITNISLTAEVFPGNVSIQQPTIQLSNTLLKFNDLSFHPDSLKHITRLGSSQDANLVILKGSYITLADFSPLVPQLKALDNTYSLDLNASGTINNLSIKQLTLKDISSGNLSLSAKGNITNITDIDSLYINNISIETHAIGQDISRTISLFNPNLQRHTHELLNNLGKIDMNISATGSAGHFDGQALINTSAGSIAFDGIAKFTDSFKHIDTDSHIDINNLNLNYLTNNPLLGPLTASIDINGSINHKSPDISATIDISSLNFRGVNYSDIIVDGHVSYDKSFDLHTEMNHDYGSFNLTAQGNYNTSNPTLMLSGEIIDLDLHNLNLFNKWPGYEISATVDADLQGNPNCWINGHIGLYNIAMTNPNSEKKPSLNINKIYVNADNSSSQDLINIESDFINGQIKGKITPNLMPTQFKHLLSTIIPAFIGRCPDVHDNNGNNFNFNFTIDDTDRLTSFFHLPIRVIYPANIDGNFDAQEEIFNMSIDAPYLLQKDKLIENTVLQINIDRKDYLGRIYATTQMPTKKGDMVLVTGMNATNNRIDTRIDWNLKREKPVGGVLSFSTLLGRDDQGKLTADVDFNPCDINFGLDTWHIAPCHISYTPEYIKVGGFKMSTDTQAISIHGQASNNSDDELIVDLDKIEMINIFETLDINKALIGGTATGKVSARGLFTSSPILVSDGLQVDSISYNYCVLGNAIVKAHWNNDRRAVSLDADITEPEGGHSYIKGDIFPMTEELDITFDANKVRVGFLKPFMSAFAQDVSGHASGHARLFGTFKYIDLEGDIAADNFGIKIGFTNTWYHTTDSVHITPGRIDINDVIITDPMGHTAHLSGYVGHKFFKEPTFDFKVTEAKDFLSYDVTPAISPDWYGRVFGNGSAFINGKPGIVNINVNMATAPGSTFTFVLSDLEEAEEYKFITFRDRNANVITDSLIQVDRVPKIVREIQQRAQAANQDSPSNYNMDIQVDITPAAKMIIVMDPVGGDEIKATGAGNLRMTYSAPSNDLKMYGTYTIERGTYNFTLQDIIVKDFIIKDGSSIAFTGDPYSARLDIKAAYSVNANLSDLDESFLDDKDLKRTNVPVNAMLLVNGDMRQPDISFDLEFPTLPSTVYRKVRSIVSTDEMMDRQIIYLLALNRFYTPEYMSTTKGNELFSVASSTISSRLSSMLGKLSENWTIAPNLRSDKGDFSDVEFDVALSSTLLNNRLRLNGNFGYRDNAMNNNQFIGDFDIEYLITPNGTWRLKAYNRYNDQNYYVKTAQTTQGVGIMYRRDFDKMFNFLKPKKKKKVTKNTADDNHNSKIPTPPDSIPESK